MKTPLNALSPAANFLARRAHLIALALFAAVGLAVLDDYGFAFDERSQRDNGNASLDYILGDQDALRAEGEPDRYYGVAFEVPLVAIERLLGLEDPRSIHLSRRLLAHAFFLVGGFFAWLLAHRLFGSRLIAMFVMLLFLLHPRLYAHSFFNTKDLPFLSMFMVALYLTHRAFRRDSVWAFALCGAGAGLLTNIRIMGFILLPVVLGMLALDVFRAARRWGLAATGAGTDSEPRTSRRQRRYQHRRRQEGRAGTLSALANAGAFIAAFAAVLYATRPLLWRDPAELAEVFRTMARHPTHAPVLFRGEWLRWPDIPWDYIPTWALISTPPAALALVALGIAAVALLCVRRPRDMFENAPARFGLLMVACVILPVAAVIALNSNVYGDWRQMYFLYAPMCVLAAFGLSALPERRLRIGTFAIPERRLKIGAFALTAAGIAAALIQMVQLHPLQYNYFNFLVNKNGLADRWIINYPDVLHKKALDALLAMQPSGRIDVAAPTSAYAMESNKKLLPEDDRLRLVTAQGFPSFRILEKDGAEDAVWRRGVYGVPVLAIQDARAESQSAYRDAFASASASQPAATAGGFDIYQDGATLTYVKNDCAEYDTRGRFALSVYPIDQNDLPQSARDAGYGRETLNFDFSRYGALFDGKCVIIRNLPGYPISHATIGQWVPGEDSALWSAQIPFGGYLDRFRAALSALSDSAPAARSDFDIYLRDGTLTYVKTPCAESDTRGRFALSVYPADQSDLSQGARAAGSEREILNFDFAEYGAAFDGACVIIRSLPDYPIIQVTTGQWIPGGGGLWSAQIPFPGYYDRFRDALSALPPAPNASAGGFDIYADGGTLTYVKPQCAENDARGRFALSVYPIDQSDLPQDSQDAGADSESLNFDFAEHGAILDGACVIIRNLPDYPISHVGTGQWIPGGPSLWSARIPFAGYEDRFRDALFALSGATPAARSDFDIYANEGTLTYAKSPCAESDTRGRFLLSAYPSDPADLPQSARDSGLDYEPLNFDFVDHGAIFDGVCVIIRNLPDYPISRVETGQWVPGEGELWRVGAAVGE